MDTTVVAVSCLVLGWFLAKASDFLSLVREKMNHTERMAFFDKAVTRGDPVSLYNLRMADGVSSDPQVLAAATAKELSRREEPEETKGGEPWAKHPLYGRCDIQFDYANDVAHIFDPDAPDGPDYWTENIGEFIAKFVDEPLNTTINA